MVYQTEPNMGGRRTERPEWFQLVKTAMILNFLFQQSTVVSYDPGSLPAPSFENSLLIEIQALTVLKYLLFLIFISILTIYFIKK
jgi:hypothetical protein